MQGNELGMFCDILLKVWKDGDTYYGMYLKDDGYFETDENGNMYDKARNKLAEYGCINNLEIWFFFFIFKWFHTAKICHLRFMETL